MKTPRRKRRLLALALVGAALAIPHASAQERPPSEWQRLGVERFLEGDAKGSVDAFDHFLEARPQELPYHWQRGISLYYADAFAKGLAQFEAHQLVNAEDIENAAWHFLCLARLDGLPKAREKMFPKGKDSRVPLAEVYALYAGKGTAKAVIEAAKAGDPEPEDLRNRLFFAHLYLGLYYEVKGDAERSLGHIRKAATTYSMPHYMGRVAQVHLKLREEG